MNQPSLFEIGRKARGTDPDTSARAASLPDNCTARILHIFATCSPLTDDELVALLPEHLPATIKTARSRLKGEGLLEDSGMRRPSRMGVPMIVWCLTNTKSEDVTTGGLL